MIRDIAYDLLNTHIHSQGWRYVWCGQVVDLLIARNRMIQSVQKSRITPCLPTATPAPLSLVA